MWPRIRRYKITNLTLTFPYSGPWVLRLSSSGEFPFSLVAGQLGKCTDIWYQIDRGKLEMAVVLQYHLLRLSFFFFLSCPISLIYANKYKINVKVKNKIEPKDLTLKSLILYCNSVKDFESLALSFSTGKNIKHGIVVTAHSKIEEKNSKNAWKWIS